MHWNVEHFCISHNEKDNKRGGKWYKKLFPNKNERLEKKKWINKWISLDKSNVLIGTIISAVFILFFLFFIFITLLIHLCYTYYLCYCYLNVTIFKLDGWRHSRNYFYLCVCACKLEQQETHSYVKSYTFYRTIIFFRLNLELCPLLLPLVDSVFLYST